MIRSKIILTVSLLVVTATIRCFANDVDGFPDEAGKGKELSKLVGEAYVWNHYWFNSWGKNFDRGFKAGKNQPIGISYSEDEKFYYVFFDKLPSNLFFSKEDGFWSEGYIVDDFDDRRISNKLNMKHYLDLKARKSTSAKEMSLVFDKEVFDVLNFGPFDGAKQDFVKNVFLGRILKDDDLGELKKSIENNSKNGILIKVGNFSFEHPIFYYYFEALKGSDLTYLGYVYFNPETRKPTYDEYTSSGVTPLYEEKFKHAIKRIDENGMTFRYKDGKFVTVK